MMQVQFFCTFGRASTSFTSTPFIISKVRGAPGVELVKLSVSGIYIIYCIGMP